MPTSTPTTALPTATPTPTLTPTVTPTPSGDLDPPYVESAMPPPFSYALDPATVVSFALRDDDSGVDTSSIVALVDGQPIAVSTAAVSAPNAYNVTLQPPGLWPSGAPIKLESRAQDLDGNAMAPVVYTLTFLQGGAPTPVPVPEILVAGYLSTDLNEGETGSLQLYALVDSPVDSVEILLGGAPIGVDLPVQGTQDHLFAVSIALEPVNEYLIELAPRVGGRFGNEWPYLTVGP